MPRLDQSGARSRYQDSSSASHHLGAKSNRSEPQAAVPDRLVPGLCNSKRSLRGGVMREDSRRGAPGSARAPGRAGQGRASRGSRPGSHGGPGVPPAGQDRARSAPQGGGRLSAAATARLTSLIESVLTAMEIDLESVKVTSAWRRAVLRLVVVADCGICLEKI